MEALENNVAWDMVKFPNRRKTIGRKWAFKKKINEERRVDNCKSHLVGNICNSWVEGINFSEFFSPIEKLTSIGF
jgi:hypothetical protein